MAHQGAHGCCPRETLIPPKWTALEKADGSGPGRMPRSGTGIHTTTHARTHITQMGSHGCALWGTRLSARDPSFLPSLHVRATLRTGARGPHRWSCLSPRYTPGGTTLCTRTQHYSTSPGLTIPSQTHLAFTPAGRGHRPPRGTAKR